MDAVVSRQMCEGVEIPAQGKMYRFLSVCLAHPDDSMLAWMQGSTAIDEVLEVVADLPDPDRLSSRLMPILNELSVQSQSLSIGELEATYISMFVCGFPQLLCPPYGSLYTSADDEKRLADMLAVKTFYESCGMQMADDFKDLPDHVCVEFEFLQYLCFEEARARAAGNTGLATYLANQALLFLDRHTLGLLDGMAAVAAGIQPPNIYCLLIDMTAMVARYDRGRLVASIGDQSPVQNGEG